MLSTPTTTVQVVVSVPARQAPDVLAAIGGRPLVVVVHDSVDVDAGPSDVGAVVSGAAGSGAGASPSASAPAG
jgi:hypothetical protein